MEELNSKHPTNGKPVNEDKAAKKKLIEEQTATKELNNDVSCHKKDEMRSGLSNNKRCGNKDERHGYKMRSKNKEDGTAMLPFMFNLCC